MARSIAISKRAAVQVYLKDIKNKSFAKLLSEAKKMILRVFAVRQLQSGDIDIIVPDQAIKNRAFNQSKIIEYKILRRSYSIKIIEVPLSLKIAERSGTDNRELIYRIYKNIKKMMTELVIKKINWLYNLFFRKSKNLALIKKRGILIISFSTQIIQQKVIKSRIVIRIEYFKTRLYNYSLTVKQCFRYRQ